ncbi:MAG: hypothetical protein WBG71_07310 [Leeuwenhoekiella sp.]
MRTLTLFLIFLCGGQILAQEFRGRNFRSKTVPVRDSIVLDSVSINPVGFEVLRKNGKVLDSTQYSMDFASSVFYFSGEKNPVQPDTLIFNYRVYPDFLTKRYFRYDPKSIVTSTEGVERAVALKQNSKTSTFTPFEGLNTSGSLVRGVSVGNNQNSTLTSELDLQIDGKLSEKVSLRASIQDANIPQQEGGYSQRLDEFDQIFIELYSDNWNIRAGDVNLENATSYFGRFQKKIQGLSLNGILDGEKTSSNLFAAGAIVRGVFTQSRFTGQEGNQGPYKLTGPNGELYVLIISGSERVFVNGVLLVRGETADYVIDYNAGELRFNPTFPITSEMRIAVEYQYSEQNYSRILAYGGGGIASVDEKFQFNAHVYSENDAKNQPLVQNLNEEQVAVLQAAGDDQQAMVAPSVNPDTFAENKILYRKEIRDGREIFVFSTNPDDELFNVRFSRVGPNNGNYILSSNASISRIFEYVAPVGGIAQGNYAPVVRLFAPTKLQMAVLNGNYKPTEKTTITFETAGSKNDQNLFSDIDDGDNDGFAGRLAVAQKLISKDSVTLDAFGAVDYLQQDFRNVERTFNIEFARDWNVPLQPLGDQVFVNTGFTFAEAEKGTANYRFELLDFGENYSGNRHNLNGYYQFGKLRSQLFSSLLNTKADTATSRFFRLNGAAVYAFKKSWLGGKIQAEDNVSQNPITQNFDPLSQKFWAYEGFAGVGDSTNVFVEAGYRHRVNDSLRGNDLTRVNYSNTVYLKSQLIKNAQTNLGLFVNYRQLDYAEAGVESERSLNSRLLYDQQFFKNFIRWNTVFETSSGTLPQQEFTFVQVDEGLGTHTWNDYNGDGIQQLQEFEIAQFQDQADYIRVLLPNQIFVKTHQNKLSQLLTINPQQWSDEDGLKKILSKFYNQTSFLVDRKILRDGDAFDINPFDTDGTELGVNQTLRNTLFFNRGIQKFTTSYTFLKTETKNLLSIGLQESLLRSHQLQFVHRVKEQYLVNLNASAGMNSSISENFEGRNFELQTIGVQPKFSYLFDDQSRVEFFYEFGDKENQLGDQEQLTQQDLGVAFAYAKSSKLSLNGEFKYIKNDFTGSAFSPVAYQMLEGLQPGTNFTWNLIAQRRITKFLDLNVSYFGRSSESSRTVHTGNVQIRAFF